MNFARFSNNLLPIFMLWLCSAICWQTWTYTVRQFNSRNGPVKAKFAYVCTSDYCRFRNTLLVKLCALWDDGAAAGKSWKSFSGIPRSNVFTLRWMSERSANLCPFRAFFLILERAQNCKGLSQVNGPFL